jgi:hypothetical protein
VNGTVRIERWTVTVDGRTSRIRGPLTDREKRDRWSRRTGDMATWVDVNCLRGCLATMMQRPIENIPDPAALFARTATDGGRPTTTN